MKARDTREIQSNLHQHIHHLIENTSRKCLKPELLNRKPRNLIQNMSKMNERSKFIGDRAPSLRQDVNNEHSGTSRREQREGP